MANELWKRKRIAELNKAEENNNKKYGEKKCLVCGAKRKDCVC